MTKPSLPCRPILPLLIGALLHSVFVSSAVLAQANIAVNAGSVVAPPPSTAIGLHTSVYANQFGNAVLPSRIAGAGIDILRYPGGSYSDIYHWTNHTATGDYDEWRAHFWTNGWCWCDGELRGSRAVVVRHFCDHASGTLRISQN